MFGQTKFNIWHAPNASLMAGMYGQLFCLVLTYHLLGLKDVEKYSWIP